MDYQRFYTFFGLELRGSSELHGRCPFCLNSDRFYVSKEKGTFFCHKCQSKGNEYSFLQWFGTYSYSSRFWGDVAQNIDYEQTSSLLPTKVQPEEVEALSLNRGIKAETLIAYSITYNEPDGDFFLPAYVPTESGLSVRNVYKVGSVKGGIRLLSSPGMSHVLFGLQHLVDQKRVYLCEGQWDVMALAEILAHLRPLRRKRLYRPKDVEPLEEAQFDSESLFIEYGVVGVPGASTFKEEWTTHLGGKEVVLLYDNDEAGQKGYEKALDALLSAEKPPRRLLTLRWPENAVEDVRDVLTAYTPDYLKAYTFIQENLVEAKKSTQTISIPTIEGPELIDTVPCSSFEELLEHYRKPLEMTPAMEDTLAVMLAVVASTWSSVPHLGLRVIGPPGTAKSTLAEAISVAREFVYPTSKFTGLISGKGSPETSLAAKLNGKCFVIKEADTLIQMPNRNEIESELRDTMGEGVTRANYRNRKEQVVIHTAFTVIQCGTQALRDMDNTTLGARFLDVVIHDDSVSMKKIAERAIQTQVDMIRRAMESGNNHVSVTAMLGGPTKGFLEYLYSKRVAAIQSFKLDQEHVDYFWDLGKVIAFCRTTVNRDRGTLKHRAEVESPTRVVVQLAKLALFLGFIFSPERPRITEEVLRITKKVALDTAYGFNLETLRELSKAKDGLSISELCARIRVSRDQMNRILDDLSEMKLVASKTRGNRKLDKAYYLFRHGSVFRRTLVGD